MDTPSPPPTSRPSPAARPWRRCASMSASTPPKRRRSAQHLRSLEMERTGAFDRSLLVIATPTGTGWVDPAAMLPLEVMQNGDVALAYRCNTPTCQAGSPCWSSPSMGRRRRTRCSARSMATGARLPRKSRPRLFLFGLSLGSLNSDLASDAYVGAGRSLRGRLLGGPALCQPHLEQRSPPRAWRALRSGCRRRATPPCSASSPPSDKSQLAAARLGARAHPVSAISV